MAWSGMRFDWHAQSLPFPAGEFQFDGVVPFNEDLTQEVLRIKKLAASTYILKIDGTTVGTYTAKEWQQGVNLALNPKTPQYQQAVHVKKLNARSWLKRNSIHI